ncbi:MAG: LuxR family transcriptional regulator [Alteromonadaceae bacterium]|nr:MAG: LuxR family transcriptional regulator [Alteromonadaceae bacterium]
MNPCIEEQLHLLLAYEGYEEFISGLSKTVHDLGFDYFAYGMRVSIPITQPQYRLHNNYPTAWQQRYESQAYLANDPIVKHGIESTVPIVWGESLFKDVPHLWEDAKSFGLCFGWMQSSFLNPSTVGMLTVVRSHDELSRRELLEKTPSLLWLNQIAQAKFQAAWLDHMMPKPLKSLSRRELEVLKWCSEGRTSYEISTILNVTERTAGYHIGNAIKKLNVSNKTAAVILAFQLGII